MSGARDRDRVDEFSEAPERLALDAAEIHVWRASLSLDPQALASLQSLLSPEERARAERFKFPIHRDRFIAAHGRLRLLLARYFAAGSENPQVLQRRAADLTFCVGQFGKPRLESPGSPAVSAQGPGSAVHAGSDLRFNLSHSDDWMLVAVSRGRQVGVDIERIRPMSDLSRMAESVFGEEERKQIEACDGEDSLSAFFRFWTRKEALIKCTGRGFHLPLKEWQVTGPPTSIHDPGLGVTGKAAAEPHTPALNPADPPVPGNLQVWDLIPLPDFNGALATESGSVAIHLYNYPQ